MARNKITDRDKHMVALDVDQVVSLIAHVLRWHVSEQQWQWVSQWMRSSGLVRIQEETNNIYND